MENLSIFSVIGKRRYLTLLKSKIYLKDLSQRFVSKICPSINKKLSTMVATI